MNSPSLIAAAHGVFVRDITVALRRSTDVLTPLFFFIIVVSLFPLGVGPGPNLLRIMAPAVIWVAALLATMLSLGRLFSNDHIDGTLEQLALAPHPLTVLVLSKVFAHWVLTGLPLVLVSPLLALLLNLEYQTIGVLVLSLLIGTPVLSLIGSIGAALTLGLRGGGVLVALLVLPLYAPVLIIGTLAVSAHTSGVEAEAYVSVLLALLVLAIVFAPWAAAAGLRISLD